MSGLQQEFKQHQQLQEMYSKPPVMEVLGKGMWNEEERRGERNEEERRKHSIKGRMSQLISD